MDIDQISALASEYAVKLDVRAPAVKRGWVPSRTPEGLRLRLRLKRSALVVGPRFGEMKPVEQEAILAQAVACSAAFPTYQRRLMLTAIPLPAAGWIVGGLTVDLSGWARHLPPVLLVTCGLALWVLWMRRFCFDVDRAVTKTFGWPVMDVVLDYARRNPCKRFNVIRLVSPTVAQRMARLDRLRTSAPARESTLRS